MLNRVNIRTIDPIWDGVLSDLGAKVSPDGIKFDVPREKISVADLILRIESAASNRIAKLGAEKLSDAERTLLLMLPGTAADLKSGMGYAADAATHTIETLVYNIRKKMGGNFIKFEDGKYKL